jgi:septum formation protein
VELRKIVLASASPRRLELLSSLGLSVEVRPSGYGEPDDPQATPLALAIAHARNKALHVLRQAQDDTEGAPELVVAADTVVDLDGTALNKPVDAADATRMLRSLSGREHQVHTAFALRVPGRETLVEQQSTTRVRFYELSDAEIAEYVATGEPMDKAGGYGIQGRAASLVESIDGDFYTVMGFPLARFVRTLRALGFSLPIAKETPSR